MSKIEFITVTDIETTGLAGPSTTDDQIIEVAAVKVRLSDRAIVDQFSTLIRPEYDRPQTMMPPASEIHDRMPCWNLGKYHTDAGHFADVDWAAGWDLYTALQHLAWHFFPGATFMANNVGFDLRHYKRDFAALNIPWPETDYHVIDLASPAIFLAMSGEISGVSLRHSAKWAGRGPQKHRALADCLDAIAVFWAMHDFYILGIRPDDNREPAFTLNLGPSEDRAKTDPVELGPSSQGRYGGADAPDSELASHCPADRPCQPCYLGVGPCEDTPPVRDPADHLTPGKR